MKSHGGCRYLFDHVVLFELKEVLNFAYVLRYIQQTLLKFFHRLKSEGLVKYKYQTPLAAVRQDQECATMQ